MKTTTENGDAIARAMDWLDQLREDGYAEPAFEGGGQPASGAEQHETVVEPAETLSEPPANFARLPEVAAGPPETHAVPPETCAVPPETHAAPPETHAGPPRTYAPPYETYAAPPQTDAAPPATAPGPPVASPVVMATAADSGSGISESQEIPEPAPIGDELRIPTAWCEMGSCISYYAHPAALGEVDNRSRAIAAGWRIDALGRLACPQCQQGPWFWATQALARWDRGRAVAMATLMTAVVRADDLSEPDGRTESAMIPAAEQALIPLPPYDRR